MSELLELPREPPFWPTFSEEAQYFVDRCNDCGVIVLYNDELCGPCAREESNRAFWDEYGSEERCPPRE